MKIQSVMKVLACLALGSLACGLAAAQYTDNFEPPVYSGSAAGVPVNGQNGFYNPNPPASVSGNVYTYAGNAVGLPPNPTGGTQFVGSTGPAGSMLSRSQRDVTFGTGTWTMATDIAATFHGMLPSAQNLGSLSINAGPDFSIIQLARWVDPATATNWNADYVWFDGAGAQVTESLGDPAFENLSLNHWYRWSTTFDLDTNQILEVALTDVSGGGGTATFNPVDRYLRGGATGAPALDSFRFFAGSSTVPGNTLGFDNLSIVPEPASLALLAFGALLALRRRVR